MIEYQKSRLVCAPLIILWMLCGPASFYVVCYDVYTNIYYICTFDDTTLLELGTNYVHRGRHGIVSRGKKKSFSRIICCVNI